MNLSKSFTKLANQVARITGQPITFLICVTLVVVWAVTGPIFKFSETWQLVINTGTTIITFLMVFLIQNTQNRDNAALQAKLDELIRVSRAENAFIGIEKLTDHELEAILEECEKNVPTLRQIVKHDTPKRPGDDKSVVKTLKKIEKAEAAVDERKSAKPPKGSTPRKPAAKGRTPARA